MNSLRTDRIGGLVGNHGEEVFAVERAEETRFGTAMSVVYDACVDEGAQEGDAGTRGLANACDGFEALLIHDMYRSLGSQN